MPPSIKNKTGIASVTVSMHSGTEFTYYPGRDQVQVLIIAKDGFVFKEATIDVEKFLDLMERIAAEKAQSVNDE